MSRFRIALSSLLVCACGAGGGFLYFHKGKPGDFSATTRFRVISFAADCCKGRFSSLHEFLHEPPWIDRQVAALTSEKLLMNVAETINPELEFKFGREKTCAYLRERIEVTSSNSDDILTVTAWADSRSEAVALANEVRIAYVEHRRVVEEDSLRRERENLEKMIGPQRERVKANRTEMQAMEQIYGISEAEVAGETVSGVVLREFQSQQQLLSSSIMLLDRIHEILAEIEEKGKTNSASPIEVIHEAR